MEVRNVIEKIINNKDNLDKSKESVNELKNKLKKQIDELKSIILQMEWSLDVSKFGKTKCILYSETPDVTDEPEISDVNVLLKSELYKYSGFYCSKFSKQEYVFNFSSLNKYDKENTFAIQILNDQDKGVLGKWVMPMSINLNDLVSQFPINELKNIPHFLRACKHYVDCYFIRCKQFKALMDTVSHTKNCNLQGNLGYTQITLELMGVYNKIDDMCMDITIYFLYNVNEAMPHKIEIESEKELDRQTRRRLKASLSCFKNFDLQTAFEKMLNEEPFMWSKETDEDSPIEINYSSYSDDEGFLEKFSFQTQRSLSHLTTSEAQTKQRKKRKKRSINLPHSFTSKSKKSNSVNEKNSGIAAATSDPNKSKQRRLRQSKLPFQLDKTTLNASNDAGPSKLTAGPSKLTAGPSKEEIVTTKQSNPCTSTPIHKKQQRLSLSSISDITVDENMKSKVNVNSSKIGESKETDQSLSNIPKKLLKKKMKLNIKSNLQNLM